MVIIKNIFCDKTLKKLLIAIFFLFNGACVVAMEEAEYITIMNRPQINQSRYSRAVSCVGGAALLLGASAVAAFGDWAVINTVDNEKFSYDDAHSRALVGASVGLTLCAIGSGISLCCLGIKRCFPEWFERNFEDSLAESEV